MQPCGIPQYVDVVTRSERLSYCLMCYYFAHLALIFNFFTPLYNSFLLYLALPNVELSYCLKRPPEELNTETPT